VTGTAINGIGCRFPSGYDISGLKAKMEMRREMLLDEEDDD